MSNVSLGRAIDRHYSDDVVQEDELSVESVVASIEDTATEEELLNHDLEQLIEDSDQYVEIEDTYAQRPSPFLLSSANKIRDRWGVGEKLAIGQESLGSSVAAMLSRFIAWLKEKATAASDLWLKFNNLGKATKRRSKRYKIQIMKCRHREKDYVTGNFILRLMKGREFVGGDIGSMKESLDEAKSIVEAQKNIYSAIVSEVDKDLAGSTPKYAEAISADGLYGKTAKPFNIIGHRTLFAQMYYDDYDKPYARLSFPPTLKDDIPPHVFTPKVQLLERLNDFYYILGRDLEREINKQQFVEKTHLKLADTMEKLLRKIERAEDSDPANEAAKRAAKYSRIATSKVATLGSVGHFTWRNLTVGLGGYIQESIKAFSK